MDVFFFSFFFLSDGFLKIDDCIDLMFINGRYKKKNIIFIFSSFIFCSTIYLFEKTETQKEHILANPRRIV